MAAITSLVVSTVEAAGVLPPQPAAEAVPVVAAQVQQFVAARASEPLMHRPRAESLTISDIRRARRATGVPLIKVAERSRIPLGLLRQLEWGYFFNWPRGRYGRSQLVRYARAAGLDEELVLSTVTPLIDQAVPAATPPEPAAEPAALLPRPSAELDLRVSPATTLLVPMGVTEVQSHRRPRGALVAAVAAAAAVTIVAPMWWNYPGKEDPPGADIAGRDRNDREGEPGSLSRA